MNEKDLHDKLVQGISLIAIGACCPGIGFLIDGPDDYLPPFYTHPSGWLLILVGVISFILGMRDLLYIINETWTEKQMKIGVVITTVSAVAILTAMIAVNTVNENRKEAENKRLREKFSEMRAGFEQKTKDWFAENDPFAGFDYMEECRVDAYITMSGRQEWGVNFSVVLVMSDAFDRLTDDRQYEYLQEEESIGSDALYAMLKSDSFSDFQEIREIGLGFLKPLRNYVLPTEHYTILTSKNRYEYAFYVKDYFLLNGEDHRTTTGMRKIREKYATPTPRPSSGKKYSSGKTYVYNGGDDYNAEDYDDPEEFWEDNRDEFDNFDEAADYLEDYWDAHGG